MGRVKGCINKVCVANQKKITYKEGDDYCSKCANKLYYVCKKCHTQLPDDSEKYCVRCLAKKQDHKDHALKIVSRTVVTVGIAAVGTGKKVVKVISKLK